MTDLRPEDQPDWAERLSELGAADARIATVIEQQALVREALRALALEGRAAHWRGEAKRADDERDAIRHRLAADNDLLRRVQAERDALKAARNAAIAAHQRAKEEWDEESDRLEGDREAALAEVASLKEDVERRDMTNLLLLGKSEDLKAEVESKRVEICHLWDMIENGDFDEEGACD